MQIAGGIMCHIAAFRVVHKQTVTVRSYIEFASCPHHRREVALAGNSKVVFVQQRELFCLSYSRKECQRTILIGHPEVAPVFIQHNAVLHLAILRLFKGQLLAVHRYHRCTRHHQPLVVPHDVAINPTHITILTGHAHLAKQFALVIKYQHTSVSRQRKHPILPVVQHHKIAAFHHLLQVAVFISPEQTIISKYPDITCSIGLQAPYLRYRQTAIGLRIIPAGKFTITISNMTHTGISLVHPYATLLRVKSFKYLLRVARTCIIHKLFSP